MLEVLKFIFSDFWNWLGMTVMIYAIGESLSAITRGGRRITITRCACKESKLKAVDSDSRSA
jgi:hypothetical protein